MKTIEITVKKVWAIMYDVSNPNEEILPYCDRCGETEEEVGIIEVITGLIIDDDITHVCLSCKNQMIAGLTSVSSDEKVISHMDC